MRLRQHIATVGLASAGVLALAGCSGNALASSCEEYYEFDQEYSSQIQEVVATATSGDADEAALEQIRDIMRNAAEDYHAMVDNASDEAFLAEAEKSLPMFEYVETLADPEIADDEKFELAQSTEFDDVIQAEQNLIEMCNAELT
jgi:hypothetical protein